MLTLDTYVQGKEGLFRLDELDDGVMPIWSGSAWVDATRIDPPRPRVVWDVVFHEGATLTLAAGAKLLVVGSEEYAWRTLGQLKAGDKVCRAMAVEAKSLNASWRRAGYWLGQIFAGARAIPRGLMIRLATGHSGSNAAIASELAKVMDKQRIHATATYVNGAHDIAFTGQRFDQWTKDKGFVWDQSATGYQAVDVPFGARMTTNGGRRSFCRGLIDALGESVERTWVLNLQTERRAIGVQRLFDSVNVSNFRRMQYLHVPQWIAALELGTQTKYPLRSELSGSSPLAVQEDFSNAVTRYLRHRSGLHGFMKVVNEIVEEGDDIHPHALRAAWFATGNSPKEPLYDYATVDRVTEHEDDVLVTDVHVRSDHALSANGYVVHDTMAYAERIRR